MNRGKSYLVLWVATFLLAPTNGNADLVTIDFNDATTGFVFTDPYFEDGFRIQVLNCHYDIVPGTGGFPNPIDGTTWMGFDRSGCLETGRAAHLRLDSFGAAFDLLSIDVVRNGWTRLASSNGGDILGCAGSAIPNCVGTINLSGPEWTGVTYVDFFSSDDAGTPVGFDNIEFMAGPVRVTIDIKPGSDPNCFNINGHGVIPVAVLSSETFDAASIDVNTLSFGGLDVRVRGNKGPMCGLEDINSDGLNDLVCQFQDNPEYWDAGEDEATLTGELLDGTEIEGADSICIVPRR